MLDSVDNHCVWVSEAVINLLPEDLPNASGLTEDQDPRRGVFCNEAMDAVLLLLPSVASARKREFIRSAMSKLHEVGIVGIHDAGVVPEDLQLYRDMVGSNKWTLRVYAMVKCSHRNTFCLDTVPEIEQRNGYLTVRSVKLFAGKSNA